MTFCSLVVAKKTMYRRMPFENLSNMLSKEFFIQVGVYSDSVLGHLLFSIVFQVITEKLRLAVLNLFFSWYCRFSVSFIHTFLLSCISLLAMKK